MVLLERIAIPTTISGEDAGLLGIVRIGTMGLEGRLQRRKPAHACWKVYI
jgi:hypothetical protein